MITLGIDTSCDDTAIAVVEDGRRIRSSVIVSQQALHAAHGGVVPEVASRRHLEVVWPTVEQALTDAGMGLDELDAVAATVGPGLAGSLVVGYNLGRALALGRGLPFLPVNHLEGHIYAAWLVPEGNTDSPAEPTFPVVVLIVSGGHTELVLMRGHGVYERLGGTRDDAAGEAFDKVGRLLGLGYPGGPAIQRAASSRAPDVSVVRLPRAWMRGTHDFSFSGLKTAVLHHVRDAEVVPDENAVAGIAAGFQESVADVLATKTVTAAAEYDARSVVLCGGVAANTAVRDELRTRLPDSIVFHVPPISLCTDNGAMIAAAGYYRLVSGNVSSPHGAVQPGLTLARMPV